jgi:predicted patatin/cPLA2 family phospholipase
MGNCMEGNKSGGRITGAALVLEGGGMRGLFTTGVLDAFLFNNRHFDYIIGASAGATHALSYISRQKGRARRVNVDYVSRSDYMGLRCLIKEKSLFGMDLLFRKIPYAYNPYDFESFERNVGRYYVTVTDMLTGGAVYLSPRKAGDVLPAAMASCSLPLVSPPVVIDGVPYLDGGIADSIPAKKALSDGNEKLVVILTQPKGYRKKSSRSDWVFRGAYRKYPSFVRAMENRTAAYNETLDFIDRLEGEGRAFVIRPFPQAGLKRLERNPVLLDALHRSGYEDACALDGRLGEFLHA